MLLAPLSTSFLPPCLPPHLLQGLSIAQAHLATSLSAACSCVGGGARTPSPTPGAGGSLPSPSSPAQATGGAPHTPASAGVHLEAAVHLIEAVMPPLCDLLASQVGGLLRCT